MATLVKRKLYKQGNSWHVTIPKSYCRDYADDEGFVPLFLLSPTDKKDLKELEKRARN